MSERRVLISGISGQDGAWLAKLLIDKGYRVYGTSRDAALSRFANLERLGIRDAVTCLSLQQTDFRSVLQVLGQVDPHEIYNLAGQSSVGLSFEQPLVTLESIAVGTLNLLEALRFTGSSARLYNAASSECFGETSRDRPADELSPFAPRSPYGIAKATAFWSVANYRDAYGLFASSGILFNHESPLRPDRFVTRKVVKAACAIAAGSSTRLQLGELSVVRDWGWAPEYVDAMWRMLQADSPRDYVIATGESHSLEDFVAAVFAAVGRDWRDHVDCDPALRRATDLRESHANPDRARRELGWQATTKFDAMVRALVAAEQSAPAD